MRALRAVMGLAIAGAAGCGLLLSDDLSSNYGDPMPGTPDGGTATDGGGRADGDGPTSSDGPIDLPPAGDGGILADGAVAPFGVTCSGEDQREVEPNDDAAAPTLLVKSAVCGDLGGGGDVDVFQIDLNGASAVKVGWSRTANANLKIEGPGNTFGAGANSSGGFSQYVLTQFTPPGRFTFTVSGGVQPQAYRLFVTQ